jgi:hypothetical protein
VPAVLLSLPLGMLLLLLLLLPCADGSSGSSDDADSDAAAVDPGDVLFDVPKERLEELYQQHLVHSDYLTKVLLCLSACLPGGGGGGACIA